MIYKTIKKPQFQIEFSHNTGNRGYRENESVNVFAESMESAMSIVKSEFKHAQSLKFHSAKKKKFIAATKVN